MSEPVAAVLLASRGGPRLDATLASAAWAGERLVLDPTGRLGDATLPAGVRRAADPAEAAAPWVLLLAEGEIVPPPLATEIRDVLAGPHAAYRIGQDVQASGATFAPARAPVRLVRRTDARLRLGRALAPELGAPGVDAGCLGSRLVVRVPESLAAAVDALDADAATLAALLARHGVVPHMVDLLLPPLVAAARAFRARRTGRAAWQRWTLAVLGGYRTLVAYAKLWEMRQAEACTVR